jgi:hypothetical protein
MPPKFVGVEEFHVLASPVCEQNEKTTVSLNGSVFKLL